MTKLLRYEWELWECGGQQIAFRNFPMKHRIYVCEFSRESYFQFQRDLMIIIEIVDTFRVGV